MESWIGALIGWVFFVLVFIVTPGYFLLHALRDKRHPHERPPYPGTWQWHDYWKRKQE